MHITTCKELRVMGKKPDVKQKLGSVCRGSYQISLYLKSKHSSALK